MKNQQEIKNLDQNNKKKNLPLDLCPITVPVPFPS
jgi:hypothetical protein